MEKNLFIPLRGVWYRAFQQGWKTFEYRPYGPRWNEKTCRIGRLVTLSLGYGKQNRMYGKIVSFEQSEEVTRTSAWISCYGSDKHKVAAKIGIEITQGKAAE